LRGQTDPDIRAFLLVGTCKSRARKKRIPFALSRERVASALRSRVCELTGLPFNMDKRGRFWNSPSIDRIVPSDGYTDSNVRVIVWAANAMLGSWGDEIAEIVAISFLNKRNMVRQ
jgi:hypothetical protein